MQSLLHTTAPFVMVAQSRSFLMNRFFKVAFAFCLFSPCFCSVLDAQWVRGSGISGYYITSLIASGTNLFAGTSDYDSGGVLLSTNNGSSWTLEDSGLVGNTGRIANRVQAFALTGVKLVVGPGLFPGTYGGAFCSTNGGTTWNPTLGDYDVHALAVAGPNMFAGCYANYQFNGGVFTSVDSGLTWNSLGLMNTNINALAIIDTNTFAGAGVWNIAPAGGGGVFLSTDNGASWNPAGLAAIAVNVFAVSGTNLFAGTDGGVFFSTNYGITWTAANDGLSRNVSSFAVSGGNLFAANDEGVFLSSNNGTSWVAVGLAYTSVTTLAISGSDLFAGTATGVWRRSIPEMVTSVRAAIAVVPKSFTLAQNYPNPFNPATTITYQLPTESFVHLSLFNVLGQEVRTLVNQREQAGDKSVSIDGSGLASGMYFYELTAGNFTDVKKMVLLK
jgi:hypothetical protein